MNSEWYEEYLPILRAAVEGDRTGGDTNNNIWAEINRANTESLDLQNDQLLTRIKHLVDAKYLNAKERHDGMGLCGFIFFGVTERTLREVGLWPNYNEIYLGIVNALESKLKDSDSIEEKSKIKEVLNSMTGAGKEIIIQVIADVIARKF